MKWALVVLAGVLVSATALSGCLEFLDGTEYYEYPAQIDFRIQRSLLLQVDGNTVDYSVKLLLPEQIGSGEDAIQTRGDWSGTPSGYVVEEAGVSDRVTWTGTTGGTESFTIDYRVTSRTIQWDYDDADSGMAGEIPNDLRERYPSDSDEWKIRPTDATMVALASELSSTEGNVLETLRAIYTYVTESVSYSTGDVAEPKDCLETLNDGTGDCDDQSILFCSIARAAGIPAWLEFGLLYEPNDGTVGPHAWVATYLPLSEGTSGKVNIDMANKEFLYRTSNHITEWEDDGVEAHFREYYNVTTYSSTGHADVQVSIENAAAEVVESSEMVKIGEDSEGEAFIAVPLAAVLVPVALSALALFAIRRRRP